MSSARRHAASLACAVLLTGPASAQVRPGVAAKLPLVIQVPVMPPLAGLTPDSANKLLARYNRHIDSTYPVNSTLRLGTIVSQSPDPGARINPGQPITVHIARLSPVFTGAATEVAPGVVAQVPSSTQATVPPPLPKMPNLVGLTRERANALLAHYHQHIARDSAVSGATRGIIVGQSPEPGSALTPDLTISVNVATGDDVQAQVPNLIGRTSQEIPALLERARLTLGPVDSTIDPANVDRVSKQDPLPGKIVNSHTPISIWYGRAVPRVAVPRVKDLSPEDARAAVIRAGLILGDVDSAPGPSRTVTWQRPHENTLVEPGSHVEFGYGYRVRVAVPNLRDSAVAAAAAALRRAGLQLGAITSVPTDGDPGTVISQLPPADTAVDTGTSVSIIVGIARLVRVPPLVGLRVEGAESTLSGAGLGVGRVDRTETDGQAGMVLSQDPYAGARVKPGSAVALRISSARPKVEVPDVRGQTLPSADAKLHAAGLGPSTVDSLVRPDGKGTVIAQQPPAGDSVVPGTPVALSVTVARPIVPAPDHATPIVPPPKQSPLLAVPNVLGLDSAEAQGALATGGFQLGLVDRKESDSLAGSVISQSPPAHAKRPRGTPVSITVGKSRSLTVPSLVGKPAVDAESLLAVAGLGVRSHTRLTLGNDGIVTYQTPEGGTVAARGMVVDLTVGTSLPLWVWMIGVVGSLGTMVAASGPVARRVKDWRWRRRLSYISVPRGLTVTQPEASEPLVGADFELQPISSPASHAIEVDGPLLPGDAS
jgi:beta-lactam-binding protein with PASTA domain